MFARKRIQFSLLQGLIAITLVACAIGVYLAKQRMDKAGYRTVVEVTWQSGEPMENVIARLRPLNPVAEASAAPKTYSVKVTEKEYLPRISVLRPRDKLHFTNVADVGRTINIAASPMNRILRPGDELTYVPKKTIGRGRPQMITDNIVPWMKGWIFVADEKHAMVSNSNGTIEFNGVVPGEYELVLWHEDVGWLKNASLRIPYVKTKRGIQVKLWRPQSFSAVSSASKPADRSGQIYILKPDDVRIAIPIQGPR